MKMWHKLLIGAGILSFAAIANLKGGHMLMMLFAWLSYTRYKKYSQATEEKEKSKHKKYLIGFCALFCFMTYAMLSPSDNSSVAVNSSDKKVIEQKPKEIEQSRYSKELSKLTALSPKSANELEKILLTDMRFSENLHFEHDEMLDGYKDNPKTKGYRGQDSGIVNVILYITGDQITAIRHDDYNMLENGKAVLDKYDFVIEHEADLLTFAREDVKRFLKYPDSAEFGGYRDWAAEKSPKEIIVQSWVESKNDLGLTLRQKFQLKYTPNGKNLTSVIIGNQKCL